MVGESGIELRAGREGGAAWARMAANLLGTTLPVVGLVLAIVLLWHRMVGVRELTILFVGYVLAGFGITVGYHRLFTHRSFRPITQSGTRSRSSVNWRSRGTS